MTDGPRITPEQRLAMYCQPCIAVGRTHQLAHDKLPDGRGICAWHRDDRPHPDDIRKKPATPATPPAVQTSAGQPACIPDGPRTPSSTDCTAPPTKSSNATSADHPPTTSEDATQEESMAKEKKAACSRGCGNPTHRGKCKGSGAKKTAKPADGGAKPVRRKADRTTAEETIGVRGASPVAAVRDAIVRESSLLIGDGNCIVPVAAIEQWFDSLEEDKQGEILDRIWAQLTPHQKADVFVREVGA
jgi:type IV secretory pathway VirB10-like protein